MLVQIVYFVLMIPIPQQKPSIKELNNKASSVITTSVAWVPFQTAHLLIFHLNENKAHALQVWIHKLQHTSGA